jgi:hypothetical protein
MGLEKNRVTGKGLVNLTQEEMDRHQFMLHQKMLEAEALMKPKVDLTVGGKDVGDTCNREQNVQGTQDNKT